MNIFPAIDLYEGKAVRLYQGDYKQMTVYDEDPLRVARKFEAAGAKFLHTVDLEGAKSGETPNLDIIRRFVEETGLFVEIGGGIRTMEVIDRYLSIGAGRVILGTAAITNETLVQEAVQKYGEKIAVGADLKDGYVAIKGWTEQSSLHWEEFFGRMERFGVKTIICTDISRDGAMRGANRALYQEIQSKFGVDLIASGGVSSMEDIRELNALGLYGAIIGKAWYTGAIDLREAIEVAK